MITSADNAVKATEGSVSITDCHELSIISDSAAVRTKDAGDVVIRNCDGMSVECYKNCLRSAAFGESP